MTLFPRYGYGSLMKGFLMLKKEKLYFPDKKKPEVDKELIWPYKLCNHNKNFSVKTLCH